MSPWSAAWWSESGYTMSLRYWGPWSYQQLRSVYCHYHRWCVDSGIHQWLARRQHCMHSADERVYSADKTRYMSTWRRWTKLVQTRLSSNRTPQTDCRCDRRYNLQSLEQSSLHVRTADSFTIVLDLSSRLIYLHKTFVAAGPPSAPLIPLRGLLRVINSLLTYSCVRRRRRKGLKEHLRCMFDRTAARDIITDLLSTGHFWGSTNSRMNCLSQTWRSVSVSVRHRTAIRGARRYRKTSNQTTEVIFHVATVYDTISRHLTCIEVSYNGIVSISIMVAFSRQQHQRKNVKKHPTIS